MNRLGLFSWVASTIACVAVACSAPPPFLQDPDGGLGHDGAGLNCGTPHVGCACTTPGAQAACGEVVRQSGTYVTCSEGKMTCTSGTWGACIGDAIYNKSVGSISLGTMGLQTSPGSCANDPCDPGCNDYVDDGNGLDAGDGLTTTDAGGVTLVPDAGGCTGYECLVAPCDGGTTTTLTGTVYDPAGLNPVYHAYVYIPASLPLPTIPSGAQPDVCGGGGNLPPSVSYFFTGPDGKFTLTGVPSGANIPLVVQVGKWRRMVMLATVNACATTAVPAAQSRLPQNQTDGNGGKADLPQIAIVAGACDPMECLLERIGISTSEFQNPGAGGKVDYYQADGVPLLGGTNPQPQTLLDNYPQMLKEDLIMLPCDCGDEYWATSGGGGRWAGNYNNFLNNIQTYTSNGGRMFASHWARQWMEGGGLTNPFPGVANWVPYWSEYGYDAPSFEGQINTGFVKGADFSTWMQNVGAFTTPDYFLINPVRYDTYSINSPASQLFVNYTGRDTSDNGVSYSTGLFSGPADFTFDTPVGGSPQYGRVMYTDMHLASGFNSASFPSECPAGGLTAQEKAAEFLLFDLGACLTVIPPPPPAFFSQTFTRDYQGVCPIGKSVVWRFFDWQTVTPLDSSIAFSAQTANTQAGLPTATPTVSLGTASGAPITTYVGTDVSVALAPNPSLAWLRVNITLNPSSDKSQAPTLSAWRQQFDCADSQ